MALTPFSQDIIQVIDGEIYTLSSGRAVKALTSEQLQAGDKVLLVTDNQNNVFIFAGVK